MNNKVSALAFLTDAEIILEESRLSLERGHWHRVVRKSQEATELAIKGMFKYLGLDYPKSHIRFPRFRSGTFFLRFFEWNISLIAF
ncbi:MAG: HEPN domain-containing protein [Deltaproteobacteria bacterium]|jgi:HEPN domain-containing protein|nr:HEPN domain-containing protein [Deltaproteobacteria bacterium]